MTIIATCGHEIPDFDEKYNITRKGYTREGERCLVHAVICTVCKHYRYEGDILDTEEEERVWLHGKENNDASYDTD